MISTCFLKVVENTRATSLSILYSTDIELKVDGITGGCTYGHCACAMTGICRRRVADSP